jgi:AcrR family transcriptional regulator
MIVIDTRPEPPMEITTPRDKSAATRRRLLDAAEALVADLGYASPSHRAIARRAGVHVALVNYHFGSKEMLLEAVVTRRADSLAGEWRSALAETLSVRPLSAESILRAYWVPFGTPRALEEGDWRNYLCAIAWLSQANDGDAWWTARFGAIERAFREALARALPGVSPDAIERGFRYARELLDAVLLRRCNKGNGACGMPPLGLRKDDVEGLIAFLAAGLESLPIAPVSPPVCRIQRSTVPSDTVSSD